MKALPPAFRDIPVGSPLVATLAEAFNVEGGWIHAVGFVENPELKLAGEAADVRRVMSGRFALAACSGPLGGPYGVTLARARGADNDVIAGLLVEATSGGVAAICFSSTGQHLGAARGSGSAVERAPSASAQVVAKGNARPPLSRFAANVGIAAPEDDDDEGELVAPERGDLVHHFAFGRAEVLAIEGDRLTLRDLHGPGRIREIALDRLTVSGPVEHEGKRLFRLDRR